VELWDEAQDFGLLYAVAILKGWDAQAKIGGATDAIMLAVQRFSAGKGGTPPADDCEWDRTVTRYYEGGESDED
jgi:hypothetical protein